MSFEKFISKSTEIAESQADNDASHAERGYKLVTAREIGMHYAPDAPNHITQVRRWKKFLDTPEGHRLFELQALETQKRLREMVEKDSPKPAKTESTTVNNDLTITR